MNQLTIEQIRSLKRGDWVWLVPLKYPNYGYYDEVCKVFDYGFESVDEISYRYSDYGTKWLAYKNKEQAECKGEIVELPCKVGDTVYIIDNDRHWAQIDMVRIYNEHNGSKKIVFEWVQLDVGVDVTEVWDDGEFDIEEIGKTVLLEKVHEEKIQQLIREENLRYAQWEEESEAERRLAELTKE